MSESTATISSFFSSFATKIKSTMEKEASILKEIWKEDSPKPVNNLPIFIPPWLDLETQDEKLREDVKQQILNLTKSRRNFLNAPPMDANFEFEFSKNLELAEACLRADANLAGARFVLVPKYIREPAFWKNYFYRVYIIKEAYGLNKHKPKNSEPTSAKVETVQAILSGPKPSTASSSMLNETEEEEESEDTQNPTEEEGLPQIHDDEFASDDYLQEDSVNVDKELGALGLNNQKKKKGTRSQIPKTESRSKSPSQWDDDIPMELDLDLDKDVQIDEAWEEQMKREIEEELKN